MFKKAGLVLIPGRFKAPVNHKVLLTASMIADYTKQAGLKQILGKE
jgi:hypothetical protein